MTAEDIVEIMKNLVRTWSVKLGREIGEMNDEEAMEKMPACFTTMIRLEILHKKGINVATAKLRRALDRMHAQGVLMKRGAEQGGGLDNLYWPVGFADELRTEEKESQALVEDR